MHPYISGCSAGAQTRVNDVNPAAVYIHCHAHQLNLVFFDKLNHASDFFSLLESVSDDLEFFRGKAIHS